MDDFKKELLEKIKNIHNRSLAESELKELDLKLLFIGALLEDGDQ